MIMLLVSTVGMIMAAFFPTDPLNIPEETMHGKIHQLGATLDLIPFAAIFITVNLIRKNERWVCARKMLIGMTVLVWAGEIGFMAAMAIYFPADGKFAPEILVGWPSRLTVLFQCLWIFVVAREEIKISNHFAVNR